MSDENNPSQTVPDASDVAAAVGSENVSQPEALTLAEINSTLGRSYSDKETALEALKETFSFVGKKVETTPQPTTASSEEADLSDTVAAMQQQMNFNQFLLDNPEYNTPEGKELIKSFGGDAEEVVKRDIFKKAFKAIQSESTYDKSQSVLPSNSRVGQTNSDYQADFEAAQASGNWAPFLAKHKGLELQE